MRARLNKEGGGKSASTQCASRCLASELPPARETRLFRRLRPRLTSLPRAVLASWNPAITLIIICSRVPADEQRRHCARSARHHLHARTECHGAPALSHGPLATPSTLLAICQLSVTCEHCRSRRASQTALCPPSPAEIRLPSATDVDIPLSMRHAHMHAYAHGAGAHAYAHTSAVQASASHAYSPLK